MEDKNTEPNQNSSEVEDGKASLEDEKKKTSENNAFKKPILVGKIGRMPKRIKTLITKPDLSATNAELREEADPSRQTNATLSTKKNATPKSDSFILQYKEPEWSGMPQTTEVEYNFEVLRDGAIIDTINLMSKCYWVFGRLAICDIPMHHPTISRYHAVLQYRSEPSGEDDSGFYIYDLGSTHGTFLNKMRIRPRAYVRIQVGHMLKLGCSTRSYLLNGPAEDVEKESELTVTELIQKRKDALERIENEKKEHQLQMQKEEEDRRKKEEERGVDWGMGEDADEEADLSENPYAQTSNEDLYLDDPKKTLRGYFEREGLELEYDCSEQGMGQFLCKVELPIDDERGKAIYAEVIHKGKKKEAVVQCALEACRILDRHGLLRQAVHESRKRKVKDWAENDYYDSDEDIFLDRTGTIEKKREKRMNAKNPQKAETYETLLEKEQKLSNSITTVEKQLREAQEKMTSTKKSVSEEDSLDAFMKDLKDSKPDKSTINKLRQELTKLKQEHAKVITLVNIVRPASLPPLVPQYASDSNPSPVGKSKIFPIFGKRKKIPIPVSLKQSSVNKELSNNGDDNEEEEDETDEKMVKESVGTSEGCKSLNSSAHEEAKRSEEFPETPSKEAKQTKEKSGCGIDEQEEKTISTDSTLEDLEQSLLDKCQYSVGEILTKIKQIITAISSADVTYKEQKYQNLISAITQGTNKIIHDMDNIVEKVPKSQNVVDEPEESISVLETDDDSTDQRAKKKKNQKRIQHRQEKVEIEKQKGYQEDAQKEDYNMWMPPSDQKGDGKTKLNEKYGY